MWEMVGSRCHHFFTPLLLYPTCIFHGTGHLCVQQERRWVQPISCCQSPEQNNNMIQNTVLLKKYLQILKIHWRTAAAPVMELPAVGAVRVWVMCFYNCSVVQAEGIRITFTYGLLFLCLYGVHSVTKGRSMSWLKKCRMTAHVHLY